MRLRTFKDLIEASACHLYGEQVEMAVVPFDPDPSNRDVPVVFCYGMPLREHQHMAEIAAYAMYLIWQDNDAMWNEDDDKDEALGDFVTIVGTLQVAPYMQWHMVYFPRMTVQAVESEPETEGEQQ